MASRAPTRRSRESTKSLIVTSHPPHGFWSFSRSDQASASAVNSLYRVQEEAQGIAHAHRAVRKPFLAVFIGRIVVLLGDNVFEYSIGPHVDDFRRQQRGARVLPERKSATRNASGVAALDEKVIVS